LQHAREKVVSLSQDGKSQRQIASDFGISRRSVQYILKKFKNYGNVADHPRSGRPRILSRRHERRVVLASKKDATMTARRLQTEAKVNLLVSIDTVKRILRRHGLYGRIALKKPLLNKKQIKNRLQWCRQRLSWNSDMWRNVIFSDECKLDLRPNRRLYIRRSIGSRLRAKYIRQTTKFSHSMMIWGAIRGDGNRVLVRCKKNVDSSEYQRVLNDALSHIYSPGNVLQQDGAPAHTSSSTARYFEENNIRVLRPWPAQSPDLSVIESVWEILKEKIFHRKPRTLDDLWEVAVEEWNSITREQIRSLYDSIPRRLNAVLVSRGGHTKY